MSDFRYDLLEQKVTIMQKEVSEVLQEMQTTIMAITQTYSTALKVLVERADKIDKELAKHNLSKETPKNETGIEL